LRNGIIGLVKKSSLADLGAGGHDFKSTRGDLSLSLYYKLV